MNTLTGGRTRATNITPEQAESKGMLWVAGAFRICRCHLPLALGIFTTVFGGTFLGALLHAHSLVAGAVVTVAWLAATGYGLKQIGVAQTYAG